MPLVYCSPILKSLARFETGLHRLSDAALLLAFKAKVAAKASKELENRLWVLRAEEYRRITRYMEASRDMIGDALSSSPDTTESEVRKLVDQGDRGGEPLASIKSTNNTLSAEMGFYSQRVDDYRRITSYMDQYYGANADALAALQLQIDILLAHIRARSDEVEVESDSSCDELDPSSSDPIDVGEESTDTDGDEDAEADDGALAGDLLTKS
ncbi:hypothetical protein LshimejAT787_0203150 [Lyophyllum shimeji]|uniref:Uncharacterized protein n=1 Tax=Lyophyllum shimeji TaxID=47721 RepID=A0A9P3UKQ3_LYOSH|nr:hypothetical protein LshimejAT787_0203150 [Lyophyllum shimeji]